MSLISSKYVEDEYIENVKKYKYKGGDNSIYYYYAISPISNFMVNYFPKTLAPNTVTISGWFLNFFNLILTIYYGGWKGCDYYPPWVCYLTSFTYSLYIYLDAADGKQARRLNASSPLGLLFDHGTDACTTFYVPIVSGAMLLYNNIYQYLLIYFPIMTTFFFNTWEEYYVGELVLPVINGVEEGSLYVSAIHLLSGLYGTSLFFKQYNIFGFSLKFNEINGYITFIGGCLFTFASFIGVLFKIPRKKIFNALKDTLIYFIFIVSLLSVIILNDSIIVKDYPKLLILTYGFEFAKILGILQVSHISNSPFKSLKPVFLIPLLSILIHSLIFYFTRKSFIINIDTIICGAFVWNFLSWLHFVYFCSDEICEILNINRFKLGPRYPPSKKKQK